MAHGSLEGVLGEAPLLVEELAGAAIEGRLEEPVVEAVLQLLQPRLINISNLIYIYN